MYIKAEKFILTVTERELWSIAYSIKDSILQSVKAGHLPSDEHIVRMRTIWHALGRPDMFEAFEKSYTEAKKQADEAE